MNSQCPRCGSQIFYQRLVLSTLGGILRNVCCCRACRRHWVYPDDAGAMLWREVLRRRARHEHMYLESDVSAALATDLATLFLRGSYSPHGWWRGES